MKKIILIALMITIAFPAATVWSNEPDWNGQWEFVECWPHLNAEMNDCVYYTLEVSKNMNGKDYSVGIATNGHMAAQRILAKGVIRNDAIELLFQQPGEDHMGPNYKRNDMLLRLIQRDTTTITEWGKIDTVLETNRAPRTYFEKVEGPYHFNGAYAVKVTGHGVDGKDDFCGDFRLTPDQVKYFFRSAHRITGTQLSQDYEWLTCYVTGTVSDATGTYAWEIRPIRLGRLKAPKGEVILLGCRTCDEIF